MITAAELQDVDASVLEALAWRSHCRWQLELVARLEADECEVVCVASLGDVCDCKCGGDWHGSLWAR